jgi:hypothetical protein
MPGASWRRERTTIQFDDVAAIIAKFDGTLISHLAGV